MGVVGAHRYSEKEKLDKNALSHNSEPDTVHAPPKYN